MLCPKINYTDLQQKANFVRPPVRKENVLLRNQNTKTNVQLLHLVLLAIELSKAALDCVS